MKWEVVNIKGEKVKQIELPDEIYGVDMNESILHSVIKAYRANRRQGTHATKTRSLVSGGGRKPFRQKGTGNARQGSSRSPLMPGGATVHGPQPRSYRQGINQKMKRLALTVALSDKVRHNKLVLVDDFAINKYSTNHIVRSLAVLSNDSTALLADERKDDYLYRSARNIHKVSSVLSSEMNAEDILRHEMIILSETALKALEQRFGGVEK